MPTSLLQLLLWSSMSFFLCRRGIQAVDVEASGSWRSRHHGVACLAGGRLSGRCNRSTWRLDRAQVKPLSTQKIKMIRS